MRVIFKTAPAERTPRMTEAGRLSTYFAGSVSPEYKFNDLTDR